MAPKSALFLLSLCFVNSLAGELDWWESASLYQIYPRSFQDSSGDGVGDLNGITTRLDYLKEIGITATWLSPIFESPMSDFGYDISNFTRIDPIFGTLEDFDALIAKAKQLNLKILLDFVPNHSSSECEWFKKSVKREPGFEDFYMWENGKVDPRNSSNRLPPSNWISIFGGPMWTWHEERQQFYLHQFLTVQPDLNYSNPLVRQEMLKVLEYWLDRGVDGFRIDAVPHIFELKYPNGTYPDEPVGDPTADPNTYAYHNHIYSRERDETIDLLYEWRAFLEQYRQKNGGDSRVLLAEAYSPIDILSRYISNGTHFGTQIPMNFNLFDVTQKTNARDIEASVDVWMKTIWEQHQTANWLVGNHDTKRISKRVGREKVDLINIIVTSLPGISITYYGEEIGMSDVKTPCTPISCDDRDSARTPMQWSPAINGGFSNSTSTWLPLANDFKTLNVQSERGVAKSALNIYKEIQKLKQTAAFKAFKEPNGFSYGAVSNEVFQIVRSDADNTEYRVLVNLADKMVSVNRLTNKTMDYILVTSNSMRKYGDKANLSGRVYLMPYEAAVLKWKSNELLNGEK